MDQKVGSTVMTLAYFWRNEVYTGNRSQLTCTQLGLRDTTLWSGNCYTL